MDAYVLGQSTAPLITGNLLWQRPQVKQADAYGEPACKRKEIVRLSEDHPLPRQAEVWGISGEHQMK